MERLGIYTQGITFEKKYELIREILPRLEKKLGVAPTLSSQVNRGTAAQQHEVKSPNNSKYWQIRKIEQHLEDASRLDEFSDAAFIIGWMFRVDSSLEEIFGEKSDYYRLFPRISLHKLSDDSVAYDYPNTQFKMAKKHLREILNEIRKVEDNNNSWK